SRDNRRSHPRLTFELSTGMVEAPTAREGRSDMVPRKRRNLWRSIRLTLMDPWEAFGTVALLGTVVAVAVLIGHGRHAPHLAPTGKAVTVQHAPSPQASLDAVLPSVTPSPSPSAQAGSPAQSVPRTTAPPSASRSALPAATSTR